MRPPTFWGKNNEGKKKGGKRKKKDEDDQTCPPSDVYQQLRAVLHTDPVNATDGTQDLPQDRNDQAPAAKRHRAERMHMSEDALRKSSRDDKVLDNALKRAIQSSPARFLGSQDSPIDLEMDLTPKPTRRLLFPSPRKEGEVKSLEDKTAHKNCQPSECPGGSAASSPDEDGAQTDKENYPPTADEDDGLSHLFDDDAPASPKSTPRTGRSLVDLLKTPTSRSRRTASTPKSKSSGARSNAAGPGTPTRPTRAGLFAQATTPLGAGLSALFSDSLLTSPSTNFDFSEIVAFDTPGNRSMGFNFDGMRADDYFGTDGLMPSSPPNFFSVFEDPEGASAALFGSAPVLGNSDSVQGLHSEGVEHVAVDSLVESATVDITSIVESIQVAR